MTTKSERPVAINHKSSLIIVLILAFAGLGPAWASTGVRSFHEAAVQDDKRKFSEIVRLSAEIVGREQCVQPLDEHRRDELLKLQLRFRITNVSTEPVIIHRYAHAVFNVRLSKTLAQARARSFVYESHSTFMRPSANWQREYNDAAPTDEFHVLKPSETFEYEYPENIDITVIEALEPPQNLQAGNYFLQVKAQMWPWESEKAERLQQRWAKYGYFFYYDVTSDPLALTIEKPGTTIKRCGILSAK